MGKVVPMKRKTLSMQQANTLFNSECIAISGYDRIPRQKAVNILSPSAVKSVYQTGRGGKHFNCFYVNGEINGSLDYLTYDGFIAAVGYYNVEQLILEGIGANINESNSRGEMFNS